MSLRTALPATLVGAHRLRRTAGGAGLALLLVAALLVVSGAAAPVAAGVGEGTTGTVTATWQTSLSPAPATVVTGTIAPAEANRTVVLEQATGASTYTTVAQTQTSDAATFSFTIQHTSPGAFVYRVRALPGDLDPWEVVTAEETVTIPGVTTRISTTVRKTRTTVGKKVTLTGSLSPAAGPRTVHLERRTPGGWTRAATTRSTSRGTFAFKVPTGWYGKFTYRVHAPAVPTATAASSRGHRLVVSPAYRPAGSARSWTAITRPLARWNPCAPIRYRVNLRQATGGALTDVKGAVARIEQATGLDFVYSGTTNVIPQGVLGSSLPKGTDFVIAWAKPRQSAMLYESGGAAGVGGPTWQTGQFNNGDGTPVSSIYQGEVVLDSGRRLPAGFGRGQTRGELLMHEIAHAVGLHHTGDNRQIMYPTMQNGAAAFGAGDLAGLAKVGAGAGCIFTGRTMLRRSSQIPQSVLAASTRGSHID